MSLLADIIEALGHTKLTADVVTFKHKLNTSKHAAYGRRIWWTNLVAMLKETLAKSLVFKLAFEAFELLMITACSRVEDRSRKTALADEDLDGEKQSNRSSRSLGLWCSRMCGSAARCDFQCE